MRSSTLTPSLTSTASTSQLADLRNAMSAGFSRAIRAHDGGNLFQTFGASLDIIHLEDCREKLFAVSTFSRMLPMTRLTLASAAASHVIGMMESVQSVDDGRVLFVLVLGVDSGGWVVRCL